MQAKTQEFGWYLRNSLMGKGGDELLSLVEAYIKLMDEDENDLDDDYIVTEAPSTNTKKRKRKPKATSVRKAAAAKTLEEFKVEPSVKDTASLNAKFAAEEFNLTELDLKILIFVLRYPRNALLEEYADELLKKLDTPDAALANLLGADIEIIQTRISSDAPLIDSGLLTYMADGVYLSGNEGALQISKEVSKTMSRPHAARPEWSESLLGRPVDSELIWADYAHLGDEADLALRLLKGWANSGSKGINICLVGPPGTGKTEFAKTLARESGRKLWSVGEKNEEGDEPSRMKRMSSMRLSMALLRNRTDATLLLDEAEDVLESASTFGSKKGDVSKIFMNRQLDINTVPIIWTCNNVRAMDPSVLRRMTMLIEMKIPNRPVRERIWQRVIDQSGIMLPEGAATRLATRWSAPPAVAFNAIRAARIAGGGEEDVETAMRGVMGALDGGMASPERDGRDFDHSLSVCDEDLEALANKLSRAGAPTAWSICLSGPPGTGKSEYARHLAYRCGMKFIQKRASDLISKYVGETEQKIASAFGEARAARSMLIIDEVDAMLMDRSGAQRNYEVSQVDEMLTWMEVHDYPFACTTNLVDQLDKASLRRFTIKLHLRTLSPAKAALAFRKLLGHEPPGPLPDGLTPGDFAVVQKKAKIFEVTDPRILLTWVYDEASAKKPNTRSIGFGGPSFETARITRD